MDKHTMNEKCCLNRFDTLCSTIMESIESSDRSRNEPLGKLKWFYKNLFRYIAPEKRDAVAQKAVDMTLDRFQEALDNKEPLNGILNNKLRRLDNFKVQKIDGYAVTYSAENPDSSISSLTQDNENTVDLQYAAMLTPEALKFIEDQAQSGIQACRERKAQKEYEAQEAEKAKHDSEAATYNTPEYKQFEADCKEKFGATPADLVLRGGMPKGMHEWLGEVFTENPDLKIGTINKIGHIHIADPNIEYADGPAYYQQKQRDREDNEEIKRFREWVKTIGPEVKTEY